MSSSACTNSEPSWLEELLDCQIPSEDGGSVTLGTTEFVMLDGILRQVQLMSDAQKQTQKTFGFKWAKRDTYDSGVMPERMRDWLFERYGPVPTEDWWSEYGDSPVVLDAGCGAGFSGLEMFGERLKQVRYLGVDISTAVDTAKIRFAERGYQGSFLQSDLVSLPLPPESVDVIFSEGVLHHTDSTRGALENIVSHLKPGGRVLFYVYKTKGPIREYTDDYIRDKVVDLDPDDAWDQLMPLSKLGKMLGDLDMTVNVPEDIDLLEIPAGEINLQRLFYWHIFKAYYDPELSLEEMNHINYDWYAPRNAHRQTPEEVRAWCEDLDLDIEREDIQNSGITIVAKKRKHS